MDFVVSFFGFPFPPMIVHTCWNFGLIQILLLKYTVDEPVSSKQLEFSEGYVW